MKTGIATAESNGQPKLTIPVKTRSPLEAFQMLRAGQAIDVIGQAYHDQGYVGKDFFMMDKLEKLHKVAELREEIRQSKDGINYLTNQIKQQQDEQSQESKQPEGGNIGGAVSQPGNTNGSTQSGGSGK